VFEKSAETEALAEQYVAYHIISEKHQYDRLHVACAAINGMTPSLLLILRISTVSPPGKKPN